MISLSQFQKGNTDLDGQTTYAKIFIATGGMHERSYPVLKIKINDDKRTATVVVGISEDRMETQDKVPVTNKNFKINDPKSNRVDLMSAYQKMYGREDVFEDHGDIHYWGAQPKGKEYTLRKGAGYGNTPKIRETLIKLIKEAIEEDVEQDKIKLIRDYATKAKGSNDERLKQVTLITIESMANEILKSRNVKEVAPPGWEKTVKSMKKHKNIDNPWALSWYMKNKGMKSHKQESIGQPKQDIKSLSKDLEILNNELQVAISHGDIGEENFASVIKRMGEIQATMNQSLSDQPLQ